MCYPAWLGREEAAADEKNETDFLYYSIRAGDREALDTRERPLRWPRPGRAVTVVLFMRMLIASLRAASPVSREVQRRAVIGLVAVVAVDEVIGLACCFLSHHFHTHLLRWMATCQFASGRYGFLYSKHGRVQQQLERHGGCSCNSLSLHDRVFRKRSWGQEPDSRYVRCKNHYWNQRIYARFALLNWDQNNGHSF